MKFHVQLQKAFLCSNLVCNNGGRTSTLSKRRGIVEVCWGNYEIQKLGEVFGQLIETELYKK